MVTVALTTVLVPVLPGQFQLTVAPGREFGTVVPFGGQPADLVIDEQRSRIYAVSAGANRVIIYNYAEQRTEGQIDVGQYPVSAAISMDGRFLYVTNVLGSSLSVIDLEGDRVTRTVSLPARPEGVEVGFDGRVLITTQGSGVNNTQNNLLLYDPAQESGFQLTPINNTIQITTPNPLPPVFVGRPATTFPGKLIRTPDGQFIIGMVAINQTTAGAQTTLFVYEVASGQVLRNRSVTGQSTVLSISPDGSRFLAGAVLYETANLNAVATMSTSNLAFPIFSQGFNFPLNIQNNLGGSVFSADGQTVYGAFNVNFGPPNTPPISQALFVSSARNLSVRLGIRMPENILGRMVSTLSGQDVFATSASGIIHIPMGRLFESPILVPETSQVFLSNDLCNRGIARARVRVNNIGGGDLTFSVPNVTQALIAQASSGLAPSTIEFIMEPGRTGIQRQPGTNVFTGVGNSGGFAINVNLQSREAINFPDSIRVYMNYRTNDQRGVIYPVPQSLASNAGGNTVGEGLHELLLDDRRGRVYISNAGYNRVEVFDTRRLRFLEPIEVGQLPHSMAMSLDKSLLYVGNSGGESISIIDLDTRRVIGQAEFPAVPRNGTQAPVRPMALGMSLSGLQVIMSNGTLWRLLGNTMTPRPAAPIISGTNSSTTALAAPAFYSFAQTPGGEYLVALAGNGNAYLYDALADNYTVGRTINTNPIQSYYGPAAGAANGAFFLMNGLILSPALSVIGGAERPGTIQFTPPAQPGQPPGQQIVSAGQRHVAAVYPLNESEFVRLTLPVRQNILAATRDDPRPTIELVNIVTGAESVVAVAPDTPNSLAFGTARYPVPARQMVVDADGNAYILTLSGLAVVPLSRSGVSVRPAITGGTRGIVNSNNGSTNFAPGSFITIRGTNLGVPGTAETLPLPTVMGGACVTFSDVPVPLLQTATDQITAQIPDDLRPGSYVVQVRNLGSAVQSESVVVTVQRP